MKFSIQYFFNTFLYNIFRIYHRVLLFISSFQTKIENRNLEQEYYAPMLESFQKFISNNDINKNINIDPIFYEKENFIEYMKVNNTEIETLWKSRIQIISTPRGNIIMFYDPYKLGFSYYCDHNVVSYNILNSCAMKYVMNFKCANFFIDEYILQEDSKNPLKIHYIDEQKKTQINQSQISTFMKPKQTNIQNKNISQLSIKLRNKFIYLGIIRNFSPCKKEKKIIKGFVSLLLEGTDNQLSWNNYKNTIMNN